MKRSSTHEKRDAPLPPPPPPATVDENDDYEIVNAPSNTANVILSRLRGVSIVSDNQSQYSVDSQQPGYRSRPRGTSETSWVQQTPQSDLGYLSSGNSSPVPLFRTEAQEQAARSRAQWAEEDEGYPRRNRRGRTKSDIQREREEEEAEMARAAAEAAARRKYEKEQEMLKEAEEQERQRVRWQLSNLRRYRIYNLISFLCSLHLDDV